MRINLYKTILASFVILAIAGVGSIGYAGEMEQEEQIAPLPPPVPEGNPPDRRFEPKAENIEKMLAEIKEQNPQKAEELLQLREKDPNAFRLELRKTLREMFREGTRGQMRGLERHRQGIEAMRKTPEGRGENPWMGHGGPEMMREWMKDKHEEYIKWLTENYPDEAAKLKELKDQDPDQYARAVMVSGRKFWPIFQASKDNPQLASVLKEQLALREKRAALIKQIKAAADETEKQQLTADLEKIVGQSFNLIVKRKEIACEDLAKKLAELQKDLDKKKAEIEKWKSPDFKNEKVKQRVNQLLSEKEKFEWD